MEKYEVVKHLQMEDLHILLVEMTYRAPHMHKEFEIFMVLSGTVEVYTKKCIEVAKKGDVLVLNPYQVHEFHALTENVIILAIQISGSFCKRVFPEIHQLEFKKMLMQDIEDVDILNDIKTKLIDMSTRYFKREKNYEFFCMADMYDIFGDVLRIQPWRIVPEKEIEELHHKSARTSRIIEYVEMHFTEKILLSEIAEKEHLSLHYLSHLFKDMLCMSFQQYVALRRFEMARKLVEHTNRSITDICYECGFSDYRYLNKIYQTQLGYTPLDYRNSHRIEELEMESEEKGNAEKLYSWRDSLILLELAKNSSLTKEK